MGCKFKQLFWFYKQKSKNIHFFCVKTLKSLINITPSSIECVPSGVNKAHLSAIILRPHSKVQPYRAVSISLGGIAAALQIVAKIPAAVVAVFEFVSVLISSFLQSFLQSDYVK